MSVNVSYPQLACTHIHTHIYIGGKAVENSILVFKADDAILKAGSNPFHV